MIESLNIETLSIDLVLPRCTVAEIVPTSGTPWFENQGWRRTSITITNIINSIIIIIINNINIIINITTTIIIIIINTITITIIIIIITTTILILL